jgi:ATPase family associated with various cellular activities (AAA)
MSDTIINQNWFEANHCYLLAALGIVRVTLERYTATEETDLKALEAKNKQLQEELQIAATAMPSLSAIDRVCRIFGLSPFERDILLLCAGIEFSSEFHQLCNIANQDPQRSYPTFSLALAALPNPHWDALTPNAALRRWRLIQIGEGQTLTLSPLKIDERILHYLVGTQYLDERLTGTIESVNCTDELIPSHQDLAQRITKILSQNDRSKSLPLIQLCGIETTSKQSIATTVCRNLSMRVVPVIPIELDNLIRLWTREVILSGNALLLDCEEIDLTDLPRITAISHLVERINGVFIISSREGIRVQQKSAIRFDVNKPTSTEQNLIWQNSLIEVAPQLNGQINSLVNQFNLGADTIRTACAAAAGYLDLETKEQGMSSSFLLSPANSLTEILWDACRVQARPRLDELAQRIEPGSTWDDLILPAAQKQILIDVAAHVRQRGKVYETWGFGGKGSRGLGISALFAGASGTGKTLAAEVLANTLRLDLYRIDLSSVVSKYIGETEKNLRQVFDCAEQGGAILLFDEADALFGKRSEVKDSKDRYANIEVSYLLQRMESYPGLAILTTNLKSSIDTAFLRRIRFMVQFPFPDATQRAEIWRQVFPSDTPTQDLDATQLARLNVSGGNIRNIALNAAFLAADAGESVQMKHLLRAAQSEYAKLEKSLTEAEIGGWV